MADDLTLPALDNSQLVAGIKSELQQLNEARVFQRTPNAVKPLGNLWVDSTAAQIDAHEAYLNSFAIRAGADLTPETAEARAYREHDERWKPQPPSAGMEASIAIERERLESLIPPERARLAGEIEKQMGAENYRQLLAEARAGFDPAKAWEPLFEASGPVLQLYAAYGRHDAARQREKAALDTRFKK